MSRTEFRRSWIAGLLLAGFGGVTTLVWAEQPDEKKSAGPSAVEAAKPTELPPPRALGPAPPHPFLPPDAKEINLPTAFRLAGLENPDIFLARQRVLLAVARMQFAAAQFLPNINTGMNYDAHLGVLQQSNGNILQVNREALYTGLGANAVAAGTVAIPGVQWWNNPSDVLFNALVSKQRVRIAEAENVAVKNDTLLRVADAYVELLRAEGRLAIALQNRFDTAQVAQITRAYAETGQGTAADADRAATDLRLRDNQVLQAQNEVLVASARLAELLNLNPAPRLHVTDGWAVPQTIIPPPVPLKELLAIALMQRPELEARRAAIAAALLELKQAKVLPFSPNMMLGYSNGTFGGGSNLVAEPPGTNSFANGSPRFGKFDDRQDVDVILYWTARNLGVGNCALINIAKSEVGIARLEELVELNRVRDQVATAYADTQMRFGQIGVNEAAVQTGREGFEEDLRRVRGAQGRPIEVLDSIRLLADARYTYLDSICDYNEAQFALYVALGQPPADKLARPVPPDLVPPPLIAPPHCDPLPPPPRKDG